MLRPRRALSPLKYRVQGVLSNRLPLIELLADLALLMCRATYRSPLFVAATANRREQAGNGATWAGKDEALGGGVSTGFKPADVHTDRFSG